MSKPSILYVITKSNFGGAQRYVFDLAVAMQEAGHRVAVASAAEGIMVDKLTTANIQHLPVHSFQRDINASKEIGVVKELTNYIKEFKPDIIHLNSSKAGLIGAVIAHVLRVPKIIYTSHGWAFNEDRSLPAKISFTVLHWLTVVLSDQTIAVSKAIKKQLPGPLVKKKMTVIHLGRKEISFLEKEVAREFLVNKNPQLSHHNKDIWMVTIAELHPTKQHHIAIEAVAKLKSEGINLRHLIIGGGQEKEKLEQLIKEKDLSQNVFLLGTIDDAAKYLKAFDIFVLASRSEAFGYAVLEAAAAKLPIVASLVGGIPEVVENGSEAILVTPPSDIGFANGIKTYLSDTAKADRFAESAERKSHKFTMEKMIEATEKLYLENK